MSDLKENAALKIQHLLKLNNCKKLLNELKSLELKSNAESLSFDKFQKIIINITGDKKGTFYIYNDRQLVSTINYDETNYEANKSIINNYTLWS